MNRKGSVGEGLQWIVRIFAAVILFLFLQAQIEMVLDVQQKPYELEMALFRQRIINGPHGIFAKDGDRTLPGVLDMKYFRSPSYTLNAYQQEVPVYGARLTLYDDPEAIGTSKKLGDPVLIEKKLVETYLPLARADVKGKGSALYDRHVYPLVWENKGKVTPLWLDVEVIRLT